MKTNIRNKGLSMDLPSWVQKKSLLYFSNFQLGPSPTMIGEGNPISFIFQWTSWESWGLNNPGFKKLGSLVWQLWDAHCWNPLASSEHGGSTISKACSQCPNAATRTTAKRPCSLVPALRLNQVPPCGHASWRLTTTRVWPGNRTCHLSVSCPPGIPLPVGLGRFLPLPLAASPTQVAHERRAASEHTGVFVSKCRCLTLTPTAQKQNQWGWGLGTSILSRSSVDPCAHENLRNIRPEP